MHIRLKNLIAIYAAFAASYLLGAVWFVGDSSVVNLANEDGIIENIGAVYFLIVAILFLGLYFKSSAFKNHFFTIKTNRNVYFLLLALLFFVCFGEEISWGQRIFNWGTPEVISSINMQNETNLHNLSIFHSNIKDGNQESFWKLMLNMNRLFSIFWLVFCVVVPLAAKVSNQAKRLIRRTGVPVPSAWIGSLFLVNYFVSTLLVKVFSRGDVTKFLNELKESNYGICFAILAVYFWLEFKNAKADNFTTPKLEVIKANFSK